jgi:hypothetical protein
MGTIDKQPCLTHSLTHSLTHAPGEREAGREAHRYPYNDRMGEHHTDGLSPYKDGLSPYMDILNRLSTVGDSIIWMPRRLFFPCPPPRGAAAPVAVALREARRLSTRVALYTGTGQCPKFRACGVQHGTLQGGRGVIDLSLAALAQLCYNPCSIVIRRARGSVAMRFEP